jgi:hypothetical protein
LMTQGQQLIATWSHCKLMTHQQLITTADHHILSLWQNVWSH